MSTIILEKFSLSTPHEGFVDITSRVQKIINECGAKEAVVLVFCPHTTGAITINENADPDVKHDLLIGLDKAFPQRAEFQHGEGNSPAHLKSSAVGASEYIIVHNGQLVLGTWQSIYFCEFDGPRNRTCYVQVSS
ncbi:MAG: secondary thiamine-phosphate synthase enzyme YjbQ [Spirochaetales bacterium]